MWPPIFGAGLAAAVTAVLTGNLWESGPGHAGLAARLGAVFAPMTAASVVYWLVALWFKVPPAIELSGLVLQKIGGEQRRAAR